MSVWKGTKSVPKQWLTLQDNLLMIGVVPWKWKQLLHDTNQSYPIQQQQSFYGNGLAFFWHWSCQAPSQNLFWDKNLLDCSLPIWYALIYLSLLFLLQISKNVLSASQKKNELSASSQYCCCFFLWLDGWYAWHS